MRKLSWGASMLLAAAPFIACGGTITSTDGGADGAAGDGASTSDSSGDAAPPALDASAFCSGPSPRVMINGAEVSVMSAKGKAIILNCCESAEITIATPLFQALMNVMWRTPASSGAASIDLASPPQGFSIEMDLGCDPSTTSCATASPEERYVDGFSGTLQYATGNGALSVSYCLEVAESPSQPHPVIHSMMLYAPNVASP